MTRKERFKNIFEWFQQYVPVAETELVFNNTYQLLVAVILSAQCTDKRVNLTTPSFFRKYPDIISLSKAKVEDIFELIKSISYPNNKSKHLLAMAKQVNHEFGGLIPMTVDELIRLPGVGRKTANVVTSVIDRQPNMAVDTHVYRVSRRTGLVPLSASTPLAVEKALIKNIPGPLVHKAHHWLILHGRYVCIARTPRCKECGIRSYCRYFEKLKQLLIDPEQ